MRFYVASFVGERQRTQQIQADLRERGHAITVDWTSFPGVPSPERNDRPEEVQAIAERDLEGIQAADVFILLAGVPNGRAKYAELGAAIMSAVQNGRPRIYVVGDSPVHSVFFFHPNVTRVGSIREVLTDLGQAEAQDWRSGGSADVTVGGADQRGSMAARDGETRVEKADDGERVAQEECPMDVHALLDEVRTIARNGLHFATDPYDRERYERLMSLATQSYSALLEVPEEAVRARLWKETGYVTPKVGADAAIFNDEGEILLMERVDSGAWCLPCGWVEPNERPIDTIVREVREETGLEVALGPLVGVFTRMPTAEYGPHTMIAIVHLCSVTGGELTLSHEGTDLRYWSIDEVKGWHAAHERYARVAYAMWMSDGMRLAVSD